VGRRQVYRLGRSFHYLAEQAAEKTRVTLRNPSLM
jgi:hypothetical protein